ncbi:hypothetical protein [Caulobacter sp. S45]|uniref:hypothetical protein n=1 Tax=Caulobacter sp. S45 TaxID=1641861 RepID=UPI00131D2A6B|nr:hypothetical protein [Caulobacter sp. S45]
MRWRRSGVLGFGAALLDLLATTHPASARIQDTPSRPGVNVTVPGITVTRPRQKSMNAYIDDIAQPSQHGELAVWSGSICLRVAGLEATQAAYVERRILDTAGRLGIQKASGKCQPNLVVAFSDKPDALALKFRRKASLMFDDIDMEGHTWLPDRNKIEAFLTSKEPVRWWMQAEPYSSDDPGAGSTSASLDVGSANQTSLGGVVHLYDPMASLKGLRDNFSFALVIVDGAQLKGLPMEAVGSYISMVTLARIKTVPNVGDAPSVLSIFADRAAGRPYYRDLTKRDWAFLYSLYATGDMGNYNQQRAEMGYKMERIMIGKWPRATAPELETAAPDPAQ